MVLFDVQWVLNNSLAPHFFKCLIGLLFLSLLVDDVANSGCTLALRLCAYFTLGIGRRGLQMWWSWRQHQLFFHHWLSLSCGLSLGSDRVVNPRGLLIQSQQHNALKSYTWVAPGAPCGANKLLALRCKHTNVFQLRLQLFVELAHEAFTTGAALGAQFPFHLKVNFANMTYSTFY